MSSSAQSSPSISRPRPLSMLNRPVRRSTGSAPQDIQRSLSAVARKISTTSMPSINTVTDDVKSPSTPPTATANGQGHKPGFSAAGLAPRPASDGHSLPTTPLSPLSPVFTAISAEPLQPQQLMSAASKLSSSNVSTPTPTPPQSLTDSGEFSDKYAALADLDSVFSDPAKASFTTINWSGAPSMEEESEEGSDPADQSKAGSAVHQGHPTSENSGGVARNSARRSGLTTVGGAPLNGGTASPYEAAQTQAAAVGTAGMSSPSLGPTLSDPADLGGDKYAALANLHSAFSADPATSIDTQTTTIDWGTSQSADSSAEASSSAESPTTTASVGGGVMIAGTAPSAAGVMMSSSPPSRAMMIQTAAGQQQQQLYGPPITHAATTTTAAAMVYGVQVTLPSQQQQQQQGYCAPVQYNASPSMAHPHPHLGFVPTTTTAAYVYPHHHHHVLPSAAAQQNGGVGINPYYSSPSTPVVQGHPVPAPYGFIGSNAPMGFQAAPVWGGQMVVGGNNAQPHATAAAFPTPGPAPSSSNNHPFVMGSQMLPGQVPLCWS